MTSNDNPSFEDIAIFERNLAPDAAEMADELEFLLKLDEWLAENPD